MAEAVLTDMDKICAVCAAAILARADEVIE
jgi:hypothetical protein